MHVFRHRQLGGQGSVQLERGPINSVPAMGVAGEVGHIVAPPNRSHPKRLVQLM